MIPEIKDPSKIAIFATSIASLCSLVKARLEINIDMVKPIPAKSPAPKICHQLMPLGRAVILSFSLIKVIKKIPKGLPKQSPKITLKAPYPLLN